MIKELQGMSRLTGLTTLHMRENQLDNLDGLSEEMKSLQYINLRYTCIMHRHTSHSIISFIYVQWFRVR